MRALARTIAGAFALLAASAATHATAAPTQSPAPATLYECPDGQTVSARYPDTSTATIEYRGARHVLKSAPSADGVRYVGDGLQWWTKGLTVGMISRLARGADHAEPGPECHARTASAGPSS